MYGNAHTQHLPFFGPVTPERPSPGICDLFRSLVRTITDASPASRLGRLRRLGFALAGFGATRRASPPVTPPPLLSPHESALDGPGVIPLRRLTRNPDGAFGVYFARYLPSFEDGAAPVRLPDMFIPARVFERRIKRTMPVDEIEHLRSLGFALPEFDLNRRLVPVDMLEKFGRLAFGPLPPSPPARLPPRFFALA